MLLIGSGCAFALLGIIGLDSARVAGATELGLVLAFAWWCRNDWQ